MLRVLRYLWAFPTSLPGLLAAVLTLATGGHGRRCGGTLEVWGGFSRWLLARTPIGAQAMTLGHVILGRDLDCLENCRDHERVHVRQAERWGPFFLPAYLLASLWAHLAGRHYYRDNWFEIDAVTSSDVRPGWCAIRQDSSYAVRRARARELPLLPELERRAGRRFEQVEALAGMTDDLSPLEELEEAHQAGRVWVAVAGGEVVGFAYAAILDECCHLEEVSVLPEYGRLGIGTALVDTVCKHAARAGMRGVTLTTFRDVPWNAPFYRRLGFEVLNSEDLSPGLSQAVADEAWRGLPTELRVAMILRRSRLMSYP